MKQKKTDAPAKAVLIEEKDAVFVYTNIFGTTLTIDGDDVNEAACVTAELMVRDLESLLDQKNNDLAKLNGVKNGVYQAAFLTMINAIKNKDETPECIRVASASLQKEADNVSSLCKKMEKNGVFPGSDAYGRLLNTKYYLNKWEEHLKLLILLADSAASA